MNPDTMTNEQLDEAIGKLRGDTPTERFSIYPPYSTSDEWAGKLLDEMPLPITIQIGLGRIKTVVCGPITGDVRDCGRDRKLSIAVARCYLKFRISTMKEGAK